MPSNIFSPNKKGAVDEGPKKIAKIYKYSECIELILQCLAPWYRNHKLIIIKPIIIKRIDCLAIL